MAPTLAELIDGAIERLRETSPSPRIDAETLAGHAFGCSRTALITRATSAPPQNNVEQFRALVERRRAGEPVAYLTGHREFWSLDLVVTPATLIPRPETEILVEQALTRIPIDARCTVVDLGTGSGAIALAIARERPRAFVIATDVSTDALAVAEANARRLAIANIEFRHGDWFAALAGVTAEVIVSNPPYVRAGDAHLAAGDLRFEPPAALVAGADGLDAIRRIAARAPAHLAHDGWLALEHGTDQAGAVAELLTAHGFHSIAVYRDLAGHARVTGAAAPRRSMALE